MKRVPRPKESPEGLRDYQAVHEADVAASGRDAKAAWDRFRSDPTYKGALQVLLGAQQGLCAYCERRLTRESGHLQGIDRQIEHVLSKAGGAGRVLDFDNFVLCCSGGSQRERDPRYLDPDRHYQGGENVSCGQAKGEQDLPVGCDPRLFPWLPSVIEVGIDGKLLASPGACAQEGIDPKDLQQTVDEILNLNCERLRVPRSKIAGNVQRWILEILEAVPTDSGSLPEEVQQWLCAAVGERLRPDCHGQLHGFWSTERHYLEPWASAWITANRQVLESACKDSAE